VATEAVRPGSTVADEQYAKELPSRNLPPAALRDMPEPLPLRKIIGPSVILAGLGVGSGEYIIWPFIASNVGLVLLWAAIVSVTLQYFINMEIERYTLATGETAVSGFVRYWKPWGWLFCIFAVVPNLWPGWGTAGMTALSFLLGGGDVAIMSICLLLALALALTLSPVVYQTLEKAEFFKVGMTVVFLIVAIFAATSIEAWGDLSGAVTGFGTLPTGGDLAIATVLSGLVFAGAGGVNNLVQSNWIRDKGFGMGAYIPRIVSPVTGEDQAEPSTGYMVRDDPENVARFKKWFSVANKEQLMTFWFICVASIITFSVVAYSTVYARGVADEASLDFILAEGNALKQIVGPWFGSFFWLFGTISLTLVALGVLDYVARLVADVAKTVYLPESRTWTESRFYVLVVWAMAIVGSLVLLSGFDQPLVLLVVSACLNGGVMVVYCALLINLNRRGLPAAIRLSGVRLGVMIFAFLFYGYFVTRLIIEQLGNL